MITPELREELMDLAKKGEDCGEVTVQPADLLELIDTYDWLLKNRKALLDLVDVTKVERNTANADRDRWRLRALRSEKVREDSITTRNKRQGW